MLDTPANRALVNRGIAEARGHEVLTVHDDGSIDCLFDKGWPPKTYDYGCDLNACYGVCEERGLMCIARNDVPRATIWRPGTVLNKGVIQKEGGTDLRWLVALAVWEAVKAQGNGSD